MTETIVSQIATNINARPKQKYEAEQQLLRKSIYIKVLTGKNVRKKGRVHFLCFIFFACWKWSKH